MPCCKAYATPPCAISLLTCFFFSASHSLLFAPPHSFLPSTSVSFSSPFVYTPFASCLFFPLRSHHLRICAHFFFVQHAR
jgi:hypothetical protein